MCMRVVERITIPKPIRAWKALFGRDADLNPYYNSVSLLRGKQYVSCLSGGRIMHGLPDSKITSGGNHVFESLRGAEHWIKAQYTPNYSGLNPKAVSVLVWGDALVFSVGGYVGYAVEFLTADVQE